MRHTVQPASLDILGLWLGLAITISARGFSAAATLFVLWLDNVVVIYGWFIHLSYALKTQELKKQIQAITAHVRVMVIFRAKVKARVRVRTRAKYKARVRVKARVSIGRISFSAMTGHEGSTHKYSAGSRGQDPRAI